MALLAVPLGQALGFSSIVSERCTNPFYSSQSLAFPCRSRPSRLFLRIEARNITRTENAKVRNRRMRRKFNGSPTKPRLSVFCSNKQLYAMLVDDQNKKTLFYASTLQKSICETCSCSSTIGLGVRFTILGSRIACRIFEDDNLIVSRPIEEAAQRVGEELVKACKDRNISEISFYDRNGFARGERMAAFEIPISQHGFLPR